MSGARTWILQHRGSTVAFESIEIKQMFSAIDSMSCHTPSPAYPLSAENIKTVCDYIDVNPFIPLSVKPCILIGYTCFLRACNLLSPSKQIMKGPHTLLVSDIVPNRQGLLIYLKSSKNFNHRNSKVVQVRSVLNQNYCPVAAWHRYVSIVNPCPLGPAFMADDYSPLVSRNVVDVLNLALKHVLPSQTKISMHSLRRGGTQTAAKHGATNEHLMTHGSWASARGFSYYLPNKNNSVPNIIANTLA